MWIAVLLSSNPVGELGPELIYLNARDLRLPMYLLLGVLGLEAIELTYPLLAQWDVLVLSVEVLAVANALQGAVLAAAALVTLVVLLRYTHRGLERRIRTSIETLAFLQGQRRKRRRG